MKLFGYEIKRSKSNNNINDYYCNNILFGGFSSQNLNSENISSVYSSLNLIGDSFTLLPFNVIDKTTKKKVENDDKFIELLHNNSRFNFYNLIKQLILDIYRNGSSYLYLEYDDNGYLNDIIYIPTYDVIEYDTKNNLYKINGFNSLIESYKILHFSKYTDRQGKGRGTLQSAYNSILLNDKIYQNTKESFDNNSQLSGILSSNSNLTSQQIQNIRNSFHTNFTENGKGLAILPAQFSYQPTKSNNNDSQLYQNRDYTNLDIARYFNVPLSLIGLEPLSNYSEVIKLFTLACISPLVKLFESEINKKVYSYTNYQLNIDESYLLDKESRSKYLLELQKSGVITINEVRNSLAFEPISEEIGNMYFIPYTDISQNTINNSDTPKDDELK